MTPVDLGKGRQHVQCCKEVGPAELGLETEKALCLGESEKRMMKIPRWLRIFVAIALMVVLFARVDWSDLLARVRTFSWPIIGLTVALLAIQLLTNAVKWRFALLIHGLRFQAIVLIRVVSAAFFLNNFLPSAIGGDAYRVWRTITPDGGKLRAFSAVLLDRLVGLGAMLFLGAIGAFALRDSSAFARVYILATGVGVVLLGGLVAIVKLGLFAALLTRIEKHAPFKALLEHARAILKPSTAWLSLVVFSLLFQGTSAAVFYVLFRDLGVEVGMAACSLLAVGAGLAAIFPVSINGIGVVEGSVAGVAVAMGIPYEAAIVVSVTIRLLLLPVSALCGLVYLYEPPSASAQVSNNDSGHAQ